MEFKEIIKTVDGYFSGKLSEHGPTPQGVGWNSTEAQIVRFDQLLKICAGDNAFTIIDYGCGYGLLADYMLDRGFEFTYQGFDISESMIRKAVELHGGLEFCGFFASEEELKPADYTVESGIFNVKLDHCEETWKDYALATLDKMDKLSVKGFAFNMLTKYSDPDRMRPDLCYFDPCFIFDYCKTRYSKQVALMHDYGIYDFTILVRKQLPK